MADITLDLIRQKEGFQPTAYWDRNAWRVGYGSDTMTNADGTFVRVTKDSVTTKPDAERDLARRVPEFQRTGIIAYVGQDAFDAMTPEAKAAVSSLTYNYGSLRELPSLVKAIKSGDNTKIGNAISDRSVDNGGLNAGRRKDEAALVLGHPPVPGGMASDGAKYEFTKAGKPINPDNGFLMSETDPRYGAAMTKVAPGAPAPMPRSAGSDARKAAADRAAAASGSTYSSTDLPPAATPAKVSVAAKPPTAAKPPVAGLKLPVAPAARSTVLTSPAPKPPVTGLKLPVAPAIKPASAAPIKSAGIAGTVQMAAARPANQPPPPANTALDTMLGKMASPTKPPVTGLKLPVAPVVQAGRAPLPAPAPLTFSPPVYKTITVLNPAAKADLLIAKPASAPAAKPAPKYIERRVLVAPAKPVAKPVVRPVIPAGLTPAQAYAATNKAAVAAAAANAVKKPNARLYGGSDVGSGVASSTNPLGI